MADPDSLDEQLQGLSAQMGDISAYAVELAEENQALKELFTTSMYLVNKLNAERDSREEEFSQLAKVTQPGSRGRTMRAFNFAFFIFCALLFCLLLGLVIRMKTSLWIPEYF